LRPSTGPNGQRYSAQVRCVAECGCESAPSMPGWSRNPGLQAQQAQPFGHVLSAGPLNCQEGMLAAVPLQQTAMQQAPLPQQVAHTLYGISDPAMVAAMGMSPWLAGTQASVDVQVAAADCSPAAAAGAAMPTYFTTGAGIAAATQVEPSVMEPPTVGFTAPTAPVMTASRAQPMLPTAMLAREQREPPVDAVGCEECLLLD